MSQKTLYERFPDYIVELLLNSEQSQQVTLNRVFQRANTKNRAIVDSIISELSLPDSRIVHYEHLQELYNCCRKGNSCLILMEHYSNFDIPCFCYLVERQDLHGKEIADAIIAMAAMKLNEESKFVLAFSEAFARVIIYPARRIAALGDADDSQSYTIEIEKAHSINRGAHKELVTRKGKGHIILMFPSGTRYRPNNPDSKRVLTAVDSYIKLFDYMVFIGIAGNILRINKPSDMSEDFTHHDTVIFAVSTVERCYRFREMAFANATETEDTQPSAKKQAVANLVERRFAAVHKVALSHHPNHREKE